MATIPPTTTVIVSQPSTGVVQQSPAVKQYKNIVLGLSITETIIGSISIVIGIVLSSYGGRSYSSGYSFYGYGGGYYASPVGEGIWCGIWILVAGCLGIAATRKRATSCMINCHMGFAITASVFAAGQTAGSGILASLMRSSFYSGFSILLSILGFIAFIICIVSASYCCPLHTAAVGRPSCCGSGCCDEVPMQHQVGTQQQVMYMQPSQNQVMQYATQPQVIMQNPGQQFVGAPLGYTGIPGSTQQAVVIQNQPGQAQGMVMTNPHMAAQPPQRTAMQQPQGANANPNPVVQKQMEAEASANQAGNTAPQNPPAYFPN
uniref:uncharacterized protein LOC100184277 isoform X2 n=1 Tax=Ciona intestinalis TaxID=7719 RepID=UPI00006A4C88|nr:uncharacterized protein LOC100184277 isoform X2 [Ciona intestinalis]|eukprot:XP_009858078.1 uncharacterized protein LOC100184277 isoform X2 [Ciona intestinalis]